MAAICDSNVFEGTRKLMALENVADPPDRESFATDAPTPTLEPPAEKVNGIACMVNLPANLTSQSSMFVRTWHV